MLMLRDPMFREFNALVDSLWGSSPFDGAHEAVDFTTVKQQFPGPGGVGGYVGRSR